MLLEIKVPATGESVTEVTVGQLLVDNGSFVEMDEAICELESDKANFEVLAEAAGTVNFLVEEGDDIPVGTLLCTIDTSASGDAPSSEEAAAPIAEVATVDPVVEVTSKTTYATGHPSPAAAKLMSEHNITASQIKGSGKDGRILKEDIEAYLHDKPSQDAQKTVTPPKPETSSPTPVAPTTISNRQDSVEKMSRLRRTISKRLVFAKNSTAMLTTFNEVDLTEIKAIRSKYKEQFKEKHQIGLGFMSFFSKACAIALMDFPAVNAYISDEEYIEYHNYVDISIAVSTPKGLMVPVVRNAQTMSLQEIENAIKVLALKGRDNKLTMEDMTGGTFTISNGGVFGSLQSTPILNPPQSAILGMHKIQDRPMVVNGEIVIRPMMYLALSYDHRIIDGKEAVSFLVRIKELLEEPLKMFLAL